MPGFASTTRGLTPGPVRRDRISAATSKPTQTWTEPPVVDVQRADRPYATFYLGFTSTQRDVPALTDWLSRTLQPQLSTLEGVQKVSFEGSRALAMRVWIDPDRLAARNLSPGDVHEALRRNNYPKG